MIIHSFLICDDIRREASNKLILVGVYDWNINLPKKIKFPRPMLLAFFCRFQIEKSDSEFDEFTIQFYLDDKPVLQGGGQIIVKDLSKPITLTDRVLIPIPNPGKLKFELDLKLKGKIVGQIRPPQPTAITVTPGK